MTGTALWKRWLAGLVTVAVFAAVGAAAWWHAQDKAKPPQPGPPKVLGPVPVEAAPGVYLLGRTAPAAAYVVDTSDGLVMIDSGLDPGATNVTGQFRELRLDSSRLRAILLTHVHADHSLGAAHLRELTGAKIYAGKADCPPLRAGEPRVAFFSTFSMPNVPTHPTTIDVELTGDQALPFGDTQIQALATPGHTPGSVCYLLERAGKRILFTGDVVQSLDQATPGALGTYTVYLPPLYRGDARDYLATLRKLRDLPPPDLVLPGHPRMDKAPQNPGLPPERWAALLDQGIANLAKLLERRAADGANFLDGTPRELLPGLHYLGDIGGSAMYSLTTPKGLVLFDAPGGAALVDHLTARFKELGWVGRKPAAVVLTSAGEEATAGLAELVRRYGCQVVAPKAALDTVRKLCPDGTKILTEDDLGKAGWFEAQTIPLGGRGLAPLAYVVLWAGKTVILSGHIPVKLSPESVGRLRRDFRNPTEYVQALDRLGQVHPDLWLTAEPVHGQSANVYDRDWPDALDKNRQLFQP